MRIWSLGVKLKVIPIPPTYIVKAIFMSCHTAAMHYSSAYILGQRSEQLTSEVMLSDH